jgi:restriction system protein
MSVWLVRAGRNGEREDLAIEKGLAVIGWEGLPSLKSTKSKDDVFKLMRMAWPTSSDGTLHAWAAQVWKFVGKINRGDIIVLPLKTRGEIALGEVSGEYEYRNDLGDLVNHVRPVKWIRKDIPRTAFGQDLLFSLGAAMTVAHITRNDAEQRIRQVMKGATDSGLTGATDEGPEGEEPINVEEVARDQLLSFIQSNFKTHDLARLVDAVLQAEGYSTHLSPPGPDKGVDILAGTGALGFDPPRICVQVKSQASSVDAPTVRELQGVMQSFKADHGLLVSWGGFTSAAIRESREKYFAVRLWNSQDILNALLKNYNKLPEEFRAELPLKPIWALVVDEE